MVAKSIIMGDRPIVYVCLALWVSVNGALYPNFTGIKIAVKSLEMRVFYGP